jgi:hypothetical protein
MHETCRKFDTYLFQGCRLRGAYVYPKGETLEKAFTREMQIRAPSNFKEAISSPLPHTK